MNPKTTWQFDQFRDADRSLRLDVVIPMLNEARVIEASVLKVQDFLQSGCPVTWRIIVADNGSTDGTAEIASGLSGKFSDILTFHLDQRGRGRALRKAWTQSDADIVCYMDVDLSTSLDALPRALHAILFEGYDLAVGSRLLPESTIRRSLKREILSRGYNGILRGVLRTRFSDAQCGFKMMTREVVQQIIPLVESEIWFFDTELLVLAERLGYRTADLPVVWDEDSDTRVQFLAYIWEDIWGMLRLRRLLWSPRFREWICAYGKHREEQATTGGVIPLGDSPANSRAFTRGV